MNTVKSIERGRGNLLNGDCEFQSKARKIFFTPALLIFSFCSFSPTSEAISSPYFLKTNSPLSLSMVGPIIALSKGLFDREDLSLQLVVGTSDDEAIEDTLAHNNTIGIASPTAFLKARSNGLPIIAFAASYAVSSVEFFAPNNVQLYAPLDIEGKSVGFRRNPEIETILNAFLAKNSIAQSKVRLVETETPVDDLVSGKIEVLIGYREIEGERLERSGLNFRSLNPAAYGIHVAGPLFFTTARVLKNSRELQHILIAISEGWATAYNDYEASALILNGTLEISTSRSLFRRLMDAQRRLLRPFGSRFGELDVRGIKVMHDLLLQRRIIKNPVDLKDAINESIVTEAYRASVRELNRTVP